MAIKKFLALKDTTITDAIRPNLRSRSKDSNMGASDILEVFSIYGQGIPSLINENEDQETIEKARILIHYSVDDISLQRSSGKIPPSGQVNFILKLYNAPHGETLPYDYSLELFPLNKSWSEGIGLDMEEYSDRGSSRGGRGTDWINSDEETQWDNEGGDFDPESQYKKEILFIEGHEDLEVDITDIVESWIDGTLQNNGLIIKLKTNYEDSFYSTSYYTKRFFARGTEFFFKRPAIYALWNSSEKDDRGKFYRISPLLSDETNTNTIYLKSSEDINDVSNPPVELSIKAYSNPLKRPEDEIYISYTDISWVRTGVYKALLRIDTDINLIYLDWLKEDIVLYSEEIKVLSRTIKSEELPIYVSNFVNLKNVYSRNETARFRLYSRLKDWSPTIYTKASKNIENSIVEKAYFRIVRVADEEIAVDYGEYTLMSYDKTGNYFDLDMNLLEPEYSYRIELKYEIDGNLLQQPETFKFRVE